MSTRNTVIAVVAVLLVAGGAVAAVLVNRDKDEKAKGQQISFSNGQTSTAPAGSGGPKVVTYRARFYSATVPGAGWKREQDQKLLAQNLHRSLWRSDLHPGSTVLIDSIDHAKTSPMQRGQSTRAGTNRRPGYSELLFGPVRIAGLPGWEWSYDIGDYRRIDYFLNVCGNGYGVQGESRPDHFTEVSRLTKQVATSIRGGC